jgi:tetratricopeptide (TPR) repeat protein
MTYELAKEFLDQAEELIESKEAQEHLLAMLDQAEKLLPEDVVVLCRSARVLFRYGVLNSKKQFFLLALDRLKLAEEKNPLFFNITTIWWQLWGNILIQMGKHLNDPSFFEAALEKYQQASKVVENVPSELYWDWGEAWILLGGQSGEPTDFQQGLAKFDLAWREGIRSFFFRLDYACALLHYGELTGNPSFLEEALSLFRGVIADAYSPDKEASIAYVVAWRKYPLAMKVRYQLTHDKEHFEEADALFREAILVLPKQSELWLDWGELFLQRGWLKQDLKAIETGLEKLTTSKIKECDPLRASFLLGMGLVIFGLFLENLKLLRDGQERIKSALEVAPHHFQLHLASAFVELGFGLYFSEEAAFARAAAILENRLQGDRTSAESLHALFQTYLAWGLKMNDPSLVKKGIWAIARLSALRPFSPHYLNEWGIALLRLKQVDTTQGSAQAYVEEAIDKFRKASNLCEDEDTLYNWGCALNLLGDLTADEEDYSKAIDLLTKVFEKRPAELHVRYHLGLAFLHLGELTLNADCLMQAIELLESVTKVDPDDECALCELGYALVNLSELILDPVHPEEGEKMRREAEKSLLRAAEFGSGEACYHLACLYSLSGHYSACLCYLKKAGEANRLPSKEDLEHDEWLEGVRKTEAFQEFLTMQDQDG